MLQAEEERTMSYTVNYGMGYSGAMEKLHSIRQEHLLMHWNSLNEKDRQHLLQQIQRLDLKTFHTQQELLKNKDVSYQSPENFNAYGYAGGQLQDVNNGQDAIQNGEVACLVVAGGQGTRLKCDGPKGIYPISVIENKSLFQLIAEKVIAASKVAGRPLQIAFMTSPLNHEHTISFFNDHNFFGLSQDQISFYPQAVLPFLDEKGNLFLENPSSIAEGPDGNGSSLSELVKSGVWEKWHASGVRYINFILVDNPLADPFDAELVGYHKRMEADVTLKCTERKSEKENVGMIVQQHGKIMVREYSELTSEDKASKKHRGANLSLFCFSMDWVKEIEHYAMPLHLAHKSHAWKFEKFIFDILPVSHRTEALLYPRSECFAPLKNLTGNDSVETVKTALQERDRHVWAAITGNEAPLRPFELSQQFYYPTTELKQKWLGQNMPDKEYIDDGL